MAILCTLRVFARNLLKESAWRNIFIFSFWCLTWSLNSDLTSNKSIHYLLDNGDFKILCRRSLANTWRGWESPDAIFYVSQTYSNMDLTMELNILILVCLDITLRALIMWIVTAADEPQIWSIIIPMTATDYCDFDLTVFPCLFL